MIEQANTRYKYMFNEILDKSEDGFIIINSDCKVTEINNIYCEFLGKKKDNVIGKDVREIISNTYLTDLINSKCKDNNKLIHRYKEKDIRDKNEKFALVNRFCVFNDNDKPIAAVAQIKFRQDALKNAKEAIDEEFRFLKDEYSEDNTKFGNMIGASDNFIKIKNEGAKAAKTSFPILLTGETGTGKEVFAKAIHMESNRRDKTMVSINCAAIPAELLESELFGYEDGAFTGSKKGGKKGKFRLADGGTLFLDEIGDMPLAMQAKLLRALQEKEIEVIGGSKPVPVDIRVISATRQDLTKMIEEGEFREDLYYRLNVINIEMLALRERKEDILLLAKLFLDKLNKEYKTAITLSDKVKKCLEEYNWPGNIRELDNVIKSAYASCENYIIDLEDLPSKIALPGKKDNNNIIFSYPEDKKLRNIMDDYEKEVIKESLNESNWCFQKAADKLGIQRTLLYKKVKKLGIEICKVAK